MLDDPALVRLAHGWVEKAEHDLLTANAALKLGRKSPTDMVCFHAQQCVEKYLKALLVWRGQAFPRTHDVAALMERLSLSDRPGLTAEEQEVLTRYATVARRARRFIRARLPKPTR